MFIRLLLFCGAFVLFVVGSPYSAVLFHRLLGTMAVNFVEADGSARSALMGPSAPIPAWARPPEDATIVTALLWAPDGGGSVEFLAAGDPEEVRRFYAQKLLQRGFHVSDMGRWPLSESEAARFNHESQLLGAKEDPDETVSVTIATPSISLLPPGRTRVVKVMWQISSARAEQVRQQMRNGREWAM